MCGAWGVEMGVEEGGACCVADRGRGSLGSGASYVGEAGKNR